MRRMATVRQVRRVCSVPENDRIEVIHIDGWPVVVRSNTFKVGDVGVFFEPGSWIPDEIAPFLKLDGSTTEYNGIPGGRVHTTIKSGQISQGLFMSLDDIAVGGKQVMLDIVDSLRLTTPECSEQLFLEHLKTLDFSRDLGVIEWKRSERMDYGDTLPDYVPSTASDHVQNIPNIMTTSGSVMYDASIKMCGEPATFVVDPVTDEFLVCGRYSTHPKNKDDVFWQMAEKYKIEAIIRRMYVNSGSRFAIQGEVVGPGVSGNLDEHKDAKFFIFRLFDVIKRSFVPRDAAGLLMRIAAIDENIRLDFVKVIARGKLTSFGSSIDDLLRFADGYGHQTAIREGLVWDRSFDSAPHTFQTLSSKWLLKHNM